MATSTAPVVKQTTITTKPKPNTHEDIQSSPKQNSRSPHLHEKVPGGRKPIHSQSWQSPMEQQPKAATSTAPLTLNG